MLWTFDSNVIEGMATIDLNTVGAPTEYQSVDISALGSGAASELQLMPTSSPPEPTPEALSFVTVENYGDEKQVEGDIGAEQTFSSGEMGSMYSETRQRSKGRTAQFLESKGFGWLLEVEDEDNEEENKPLL